MPVVWRYSFDQQAEEERVLANRARRALTQSLKRISCCALNMGVDHLVWVLYSGVVTGMHDFRKSGRKRLGVKGACAFQIDLSSIFRRSGLRSLSSVLYCLLVVP
jgi:hypothetical protein